MCSSAAIMGCVPTCNASHHGYELLATIDGTDTKFSCNIAHGLYSWMGAASEGGYLGADAHSFFSAVVSGAAGSYIVTLTGDAGISTDLLIQPGQDVHISGDSGPPAMQRWSGGGFKVAELANLELFRLRLTGHAYRADGRTRWPKGLGGDWSFVVVANGGTLRVTSCSWDPTFVSEPVGFTANQFVEIQSASPTLYDKSGTTAVYISDSAFLSGAEVQARLADHANPRSSGPWQVCVCTMHAGTLEISTSSFAGSVLDLRGGNATIRGSEMTGAPSGGGLSSTTTVTTMGQAR